MNGGGGGGRRQQGLPLPLRGDTRTCVAARVNNWRQTVAMRT